MDCPEGSGHLSRGLRVVLRVVAAATVVVAVGVAVNQVLNGGKWNLRWLVGAILVAVLAEALNLWLGDRGETAAPAGASARVAAAANTLARQMDTKWLQEAAHRRIITPAPATVRWGWAADELTASRQDVARPPAPGTGPPPLPDLEVPGELLGSGVVTYLHKEVYAKLPHGRLVLLGGPGAGKTGAMILLLLAALDYRRSVAKEVRSEVPVPVWLTLGGWNPASTTLHEWAVATMNRDYPVLLAPEYGPDAAGELLNKKRVALFLDGLDELPEGLRAQALERLNEEARALRVVVTSRPEEYQNALQAGSLDNTAVIELRPVRPAAAADYLLKDQVGPGRQRWLQVCDYIKNYPDSIAAEALNNPLNLSLARQAYSSQDPIELAEPTRFRTVKAVREHLVARLLITAYPDEHQRTHATLWLAWLAHHMGTGTELYWWDIPTWIPRRQLRVTRGLAIGLGVGLGMGLGLGVGTPSVGLISGLAAGTIAALFIGLVSGIEFGRAREPHILVPHWPRSRDFLRIGRVMAGTGIVVGSVAGLTVALTAGPALGLVTAEVTGLVVGLTAGILDLWAIPIASSPSATPTATYRADRRTSLLYGVASGFAFAVSFTFPYYTPLDILYSSATLLLGLGFGLAVGQVPMVKFTELALTYQGWGRVHFRRILEDAYERQILRQAGACYQFRHAELKSHFAASYASLETRRFR
jgi:hypothetical protein